jgi:hypothetical protein
MTVILHFVCCGAWVRCWHFSGVSGTAPLQPKLKQDRTNRGPA